MVVAPAPMTTLGTGTVLPVDLCETDTYTSSHTPCSVSRGARWHFGSSRSVQVDGRPDAAELGRQAMKRLGKSPWGGSHT